MKNLEMPFQVSWDITHNCNLRCKHCFFTKEQLSDKTCLSKDEAISFVNNIASDKVFHLSIAGGEPLLYPHIVDVVSEATDAGMLVAMSTNAILLTESLAKNLRAAGLSSLQISLDGASEAVNDFVRGRGSFEKTIQGIEIARKNGFKILIAFVLLKHNHHELEDLFKLAITLGAYGVKVQTLIESGLGEENKDKIYIEEHDLRQIIFNAWDLKRNYQESLEIMLPLIPEVIASSKEAPEYYYQKSSCLGCQPGLTTVRVDSYGGVRACGGFSAADSNVGNINEDSLKNIYKNSKELIRWRNASKVFDGEQSTSCGSICGKGCRSATAPDFAKT